MIDNRELRIGNLIEEINPKETNPSCRFQLVEGFYDAGDYGFRITTNITELGPADFQPIPLDKHWLRKAGFREIHEFDMSDAMYQKETNQHPFVVSLLHSQWIANVYFQVPVDYVHQLMNVFYALTGHELTFSPEQ